ncbi:MAG: hypothetical protein CMP20_12370 [Rickettsiales bacterium]|nr:hypothetical protein [Rickettsiales bacterium]
MSNSLDERVMQFQMLELPGQPMMMHMGTSHLVQDLHREVKQARQIITDLVEYAECNDPGNPHIGRAKGFLSGGEG